MSTPFYGKAYIIDNAPTPAAPVSITSSTSATPIVVTTAAAHGLQTGVAVIINGHATNTAANGVWRAHVLTSTTFRLLNFDGTDSVGVASGSGGTSQSLMLPGFNIGEDAVDDINASLLNVPNEALGNMVAWLAYRMLSNMQILAGGNLQILPAAGFGISEGATAFCADAFTLSGSPTTPARLTYSTRSRLNIEVTRLSNADHTVNASTDGPVILLGLPTATRTITIEQASDTVKQNGDTLEFYIPAPPLSGAGTWVFKRESSLNDICTYTGTVDAGATFWPGFVRIHLEGGNWRYSGGSMGVTPGADA